MNESTAVNRQRLVSLFEALLGAVFVVGHCVFKVLPSEVTLMLIAAWISMEMRGQRWSTVGLSIPPKFTKSLLTAFLIAVAYQTLSLYALDPLLMRLWHEKPDLSAFKELAGNWKASLILLATIWTVAAFGEEITYRGYLARRFVDAFGNTRRADWLSVVVVSILFGLGHFYQGPAGASGSVISGLIYGTLYLTSGKNLWLCIFTHGFVDTVGLAMIGFGWVNIS